MTIFVSIAAYRDPELIPTIQDCLRRARYPEELRFGICWQHADDEAPPPVLANGRMRLIDVPWRESQGACWARAEVMKLYDGEDYFLQIDSHHRFVQDWDALLLDQADRSGAAKPLLTTYASHDGYGDSPAPPGEATRMIFSHFNPEGVPIFNGSPMPDAASRTTPMRARFVSAHLLFTLGAFVSEVPYDPDLYFFGEEITLAIRAFTHGYSLFHPSVHIMWHQWPRPLIAKHWDDHVPELGAAIAGRERDRLSLAKARRFLTAPTIGPFGCGIARTFAEYERYAGMNFRRRLAGQAARRGDEPPPPSDPVFGTTFPRTWTARVVLDRAALPPEAMQAPRFWYVGFHDSGGREIARQDADRAELQRALALPGDKIAIDRQFSATRPPTGWTVWPTDRHGRWLTRINGAIEADADIETLVATAA